MRVIEARGASLKSVAQAIRMNWNSFLRVTQGKRKLRGDELYALALHLRVAIQDLYATDIEAVIARLEPDHEAV